MEKISVIIPSFGRANKLERAIESLLTQTYSNIEIIVVDDNAPASIHRAQVKQVMDKYRHIRELCYIENESNMGAAISRNVGIKHARGDYIAFLDDDDVFHNQKLELQLKHIKTTGADVSLCYAYEVEEKTQKKKLVSARGDNITDFLIDGCAYTLMMLVKRDVLLSINGFERVKRFQDHILMYKILAAGYKVRILNIPLFDFYIHDGDRISANKSPDCGHSDRIKYEEELLKVIPLDRNTLNIVKTRHLCIQAKTSAMSGAIFQTIALSSKAILLARTKQSFLLAIRLLGRNLLTPKKPF